MMMNTENGQVTEDMLSFKELYEDSIKDIKEGEVLKGTVIGINKDFVLIDIGYKSEGHISINEFMDEDKNLTVSVGDEIDVFLERKESDDGFVVLSKDKADQLKVWDDIKKSCEEEDAVVEGKILHRIKGGFKVGIKNIIAFLPGSQVDVKPVLNQDVFIGKEFSFKVLKYNRRKDNVVVSRRVLLEKERVGLREKTLETLEEGGVVEGIVKNITDYGAFIDMGGIDGLLHITDISWGRVEHPSQFLSIGDEIETVVLKFDKEKEKVSLGLKQTKDDPWLSLEERFSVGCRVTGKVTNITDYGAFVEIEKGVEGLVHISEMSWTRKVKHPSNIVSLGDKIEVVILDIDTKNRRLSMGLKQAMPNPWDLLIEKYPKGSRVKGEITNITDFGIFVGIEDGIDGLVHITDLSWKGGISHPSDLFTKGQDIEAVVLNIDKSSERFSLGVKQLDRDPWVDIREKYRPGMGTGGKVTNITDFGAFVELEEGVEGLIHVSEFNRGKVKKVKRPEVGDVVEVEVLNVDPDERKIGLSIKNIKGKEEEIEEESEENKETVDDKKEIEEKAEVVDEKKEMEEESEENKELEEREETDIESSE